MPTITEIQTTLQTLTKQNKITFTAIAEALGTGRSNISLRAKNNSELTLAEILRLEKHFKVNLSNKLNNMEDLGEDFADIPVRGDVFASMGSGITVYNEEKTGVYRISRELARDLGVKIPNTEMIVARGDSMSPTIEDGDSLLVDLSKREIYDGKLYCVRINGQLYAKRLQLIPPTKIKVISDNKDKYDPFYVDSMDELTYDFCIIGEIRWWGRVAR